jgi:hypothetical protein
MRRLGEGVQFFDLGGVDWKSDHGSADIVASSSGSTDGAIVATCIAVRHVAERGRERQPV